MSDKENTKESLVSALDDFLNNNEPSPKLSDKQIDALERFLDARATDNAMHLEVLDGFLCALIVSPVVIPSED